MLLLLLKKRQTQMALLSHKNSLLIQVQLFLTELKVEGKGLCIHPKDTLLGASPDGEVTCSWYGKSLLEIKCTMPANTAATMDYLKPSGYLKKISSVLQPGIYMYIK